MYEELRALCEIACESGDVKANKEIVAQFLAELHVNNRTAIKEHKKFEKRLKDITARCKLNTEVAERVEHIKAEMED